MIEIKKLSKSYGSYNVLNDLSLQIEDGSIFGLVGINGAGKSTLLRLLSGVFKADSGTIKIDEEDVFENPKVKKNIFFLPDDPYFSTNTKGKDLFDLYNTFYNADEELFNKYMSLFKLNPNSSINNYSKGMRRQVFISLAISVRPKYLFLDEAFDGLDPLARLTFKRALIDLKEETNCTVIISSHSLRELEDICDSFGLLDHGQITSSGQINDEIDKVHKYQLVFNNEQTKESFSNLNVLSYSKIGRVIKIVLKGNSVEIEKEISKFNPILIDKIPIDFEELFIYEVESRGYLKWLKNILNMNLKKQYGLLLF